MYSFYKYLIIHLLTIYKLASKWLASKQKGPWWFCTSLWRSTLSRRKSTSRHWGSDRTWWNFAACALSLIPEPGKSIVETWILVRHSLKCLQHNGKGVPQETKLRWFAMTNGSAPKTDPSAPVFPKRPRSSPRAPAKLLNTSSQLPAGEMLCVLSTCWRVSQSQKSWLSLNFLWVLSHEQCSKPVRDVPLC